MQMYVSSENRPTETDHEYPDKAKAANVSVHLIEYLFSKKIACAAERIHPPEGE